MSVSRFRRDLLVNLAEQALISLVNPRHRPGSFERILARHGDNEIFYFNFFKKFWAYIVLYFSTLKWPMIAWKPSIFLKLYLLNLLILACRFFCVCKLGLIFLALNNCSVGNHLKFYLLYFFLSTMSSLCWHST